MTSHDQQPPRTPAPRQASMVHRGHPRGAEAESAPRPQPIQRDKEVTRAFDRENRVEHGNCWATDRNHKGVHMIPHSEGRLCRLILWLQLTELIPIDFQARNKWKVSPENMIPLHSDFHNKLSDSEQTNAVLCPSRHDLHSLTYLLEAGLAAEETRIARNPKGQSVLWRPDWNSMLTQGWSRKVAVSDNSCNSFQYEIKFFDYERRDIGSRKPLRCRDGVEEHGWLIEETAVPRTHPVTFSADLGVIYAPLNILSITALTVSQVTFLARRWPEEWQPDFLDDLEVMSYVVELLSCGDPSYFRRCSRPDSLQLPRPQAAVSLSSMDVKREWPPEIWPDPMDQDGKALFASSPLRSGGAGWAPELQGLRRPAVITAQEVTGTTSHRDDQRPRSPHGGTGPGGNRGAEMRSENDGGLGQERDPGSHSPEESSAGRSDTVMNLSRELLSPETAPSSVYVNHSEADWQEDSDVESGSECEVGAVPGDEAWQLEGEKLMMERKALYDELARALKAQCEEEAGSVAEVTRLLSGSLRIIEPSLVGHKLTSLTKLEDKRNRQLQRHRGLD